jgi:NAD(P)-dependent dehydrogenase (short-subunit alcohol dehydrogenase family)
VSPQQARWLTTLEGWDWVLGSGFYGVVHGIQYFLSDMIKAGHGHIVMTSSMVGLVPDYFLRHGPYTAVKAGLVGMAVGLLPELEGTGVGVSLLVPAGVDTGLADSHVDRPAVTAGVMTADEAPHPFQTVMPGVDAPALTRDLRFVTAEYTARGPLPGSRLTSCLSSPTQNSSRLLSTTPLAYSRRSTPVCPGRRRTSPPDSGEARRERIGSGG